MKRSDLSLLVSRAHSTQRSVLSVYLNVDQSRQANLSRGFESQFKKLASVARGTLVDVADRERFAAALHHVQDFITAYSPASKALVLFFDTTDGFFWHADLEFPVTDHVRWDRELLLQPLASAADQLEARRIFPYNTRTDLEFSTIMRTLHDCTYAAASVAWHAGSG